MSAISKWEPLRDIEMIFDRYSRSLGMPFSRSSELMGESEWCPRVDIRESEKSFQIKAEVPGVRKEDVKVFLDHGVLIIEGERKQEREEKGWRSHRIERSYGNFIRSFTLPSNVNSEAMKAHFSDGLLEVEIPKIKTSESPAVMVPIE